MLVSLTVPSLLLMAGAPLLAALCSWRAAGLNPAVARQ